MRYLPILIAAVATTVAGSAAAQGLDYTQMAAGDFAAAQTRLERVHALSPDQAEPALNLAAVYMYTGRPDGARDLYREVLDHNAVDLTLANGTVVTSHELARRGLARLDRTTLAAN